MKDIIASVIVAILGTIACFGLLAELLGELWK